MKTIFESNVTISSLSPDLITRPVYFTLQNIRPFDIPVYASNCLSVIYCSPKCMLAQCYRGYFHRPNLSSNFVFRGYGEQPPSVQSIGGPQSTICNPRMLEFWRALGQAWISN